MKKIIAASLILSPVSYGVSDYLAHKSHDLKRFASGLPRGELVMPDPTATQKEVDELDPFPNSDFQVAGSAPRVKRSEAEGVGLEGIPAKGFVPFLSPSRELEPVDPERRRQMKLALVYDVVGPKLRHGVWLFPVLGIAIIVRRKLEENRMRRLMETIALEEKTQQTSDAQEVPDVPPHQA